MKKTFNKKEILQKIAPVIENTAMRYNLIPIETTLEKENGRYFLRIYIYCADHAVNHMDCENISHGLGNLLDEIIPFKYYLEVSSPGLEKRLKTPLEFRIFKGHNVVVKLKNPIEDVMVIKGVLTDYDGSCGLKITFNNREYEINLDNVFYIKLNDIE